jgi:coproporphyrinogen III oxidase
MPRNRKNYRKVKEETQYDPKRHTKTKGGHGFGMKRGAKELQYESSGVNLASVFGWKVPKNLMHIKKVIDRRNGR